MPETADKGILIVDDDQTFADMLAEVISQCGYKKVYKAHEMAQCLSILAECGEDIYVVLLDLRMPNGDGLTIMQHLVNSHNHVVGVIVITGYANVKAATDFFRLGTEQVVAVDFISKPFEWEPLIAQLRSTVNLIDGKRRRQRIVVQDQIWDRLTAIESKLEALGNSLDQLNRIESRLARIEKNSPSFVRELGMDVVRLVVIAFAVLAFLYLDLGGILSRIIERVR